VKEQESNTIPSSFLEVFLSKLKEQSFTIVLMLGVIYFQNKMFRERIIRHENIEAKQELLIEKLYEEQKNLYIERILELKNK
tara:strand:+ start:751 stop:996 length:246 start_codon:yes stop_codon:yes gene_type:complete